MKKVLLVVGLGPGISSAVARKFGAAGFSVGLVARHAEALASAKKALEEKGVEVATFVADASDPASIRGAVRAAHDALGPITVLHWNASGGGQTGDFLTADAAAMHQVFDVSIVGLVSAVQEALPDLKSAEGAVLVTNGAFGELSPQIDALAASSGSMGLALANGAKHKLVGLLAAKLQPEGVYVGEVMVAGTVRGTAWDRGKATLEASAVADAFWALYEARSDVRARVS